jgi:hypothetical protein
MLHRFCTHKDCPARLPGGVAQAAPPAPTDAGALADERKHYLAAIRLRLEQLYDECPNDARLREHISDECDWLDAEIARKAALQETRGDEPVGQDWSCAADFLDDIEVDAKGMCRWADVANAQTHIRCSLRSVQGAPQQSPRLEREGIAAIVRRTKINVQYAWEGNYTSISEAESLKIADAILALLSPDTFPIPSTDHSEPTKYRGTFLGYRNDKGEEMHCANAFCPHQDKCHKGCVSPTPLSSNHPREVGK